jgi:glycine betaine catabolism B
VVDTALPASVTAIHLAIAALRHHRARSSVVNPFVLPSFLAAVTPWLWPSPLALGLMLVAHLAWVIVCEILAPVPSPHAPARTATSSGARTATARPQNATSAPSAQGVRSAGTPGGFAEASVLAVLDEATDIRTFRLSRPQGFDFTAGQFVPVRVSIDGKPHVRCYSISSSPDARGYLEISVRRQGLVSTTLHATLRTGSRLLIGRPAGHFVYPGGDDRPLALLAGGIGITPLLSMLRYAVSSDPSRPIALLYSARTPQAAAFYSELQVIAQRHPQVRIAVTISDPSTPAPWRRGHIDGEMVRQYVPHPSHTIFCICGPVPMMTAMEQLLAGQGVPPDQVRKENFDTAMAASQINAPAPAAISAAAARSPQGATGYEITFAATGRSVTGNGSHTLLETAEAEGIGIPSSCRSGVCQACRTRVADGDVDCQSSVLDPDDRAAGFVLPCVSWPQSNVVLEA